MRSWRKEFLKGPDEYGEEHRGKHLRYQVINDEQYCDKALEWVGNNNIIGQKNMTANDLRSWVNSTLLPEVRRNTFIYQRQLLFEQLFVGFVHLALSQ